MCARAPPWFAVLLRTECKERGVTKRRYVKHAGAAMAFALPTHSPRHAHGRLHAQGTVNDRPSVAHGVEARQASSAVSRIGVGVNPEPAQVRGCLRRDDAPLPRPPWSTGISEELARGPALPYLEVRNISRSKAWPQRPLRARARSRCPRRSA